MPNSRRLVTNPKGNFAALRKMSSCPHCGRQAQSSYIGSHIRSCDPATKPKLFWSKVVKRGDDECWGWIGHARWDGYGRFRHQWKAVFAHRYSYELHNGPIPSGMHVMHVCDNPICTNPKHLRLGTHLENMRDMRAKGRGPDQRRQA